MDANLFVQALKKTIDSKKTTAYKINRATGISQTTITNYIHKKTAPDSSKITVIIDFLKKTVSDFEDVNIKNYELPMNRLNEKNESSIKNGEISAADIDRAVEIIKFHEDELSKNDFFKLWKENIELKERNKVLMELAIQKGKEN